MCGCNKKKPLGTPEGAQVSQMMAVAAHPTGNGNGAASVQYTRVALRRDAIVPILGIPLPENLAIYADGKTAFFPKRVTVVPGPLAHYLKVQHAELFL